MNSALQSLPRFLQSWWVELVSAVVVIAVVPLSAAYFIVQRKLLENLEERFGSQSLLNVSLAAFRLLVRSEIAPCGSDPFVFWLAPVVTMVAAFVSLGALYFGPAFRIARDINIGVVFVVGANSLGFLGIILTGWNSKERLSLAATMRSAAQFVSFEVTAGFAIVAALLLAGTLRITALVDAQYAQRVWFVFLTPVAFFVYLAASIFAINRRPVELPEAERLLASPPSTGYGGFRWTLYLFGEYANMIVSASIATTLFLGGWLRPFPNVRWLNWMEFLPVILFAAFGAYWVRRAGKQRTKVQIQFSWGVAVAFSVATMTFVAPWIFPPVRFALPGLNGAFWFLLKVVLYLCIFIWLRSTLPLFRFNQLVHIAWYILIPMSALNVLSVAVASLFESNFGYRWLAAIVSTVFTLAAATFFVHLNDRRAAAADLVPDGTSDSYAG